MGIGMGWDGGWELRIRRGRSARFGIGQKGG